MEEEKLIFQDAEGTLWYYGSSNNINNDVETSSPGYILATSFKCLAMVTDRGDNTDYCTCIKCGKSITKGVLSIFIDFEYEWCVRLLCFACNVMGNDILVDYNPVIAAPAYLQPLLVPPQNIVQCLICTQKHCTHRDCKLMLEKRMVYKNDIEELLEEFYMVQVNINNTLINSMLPAICHQCKQEMSRFTCTTCRAFRYCGEECKQRHKDCRPFLNLWREYIIKE